MKNSPSIVIIITITSIIDIMLLFRSPTLSLPH